MRAPTKQARPKGAAAVLKKHTAQIGQLQEEIKTLALFLMWKGNPPGPGEVGLTHEEARDGASYQAALKQVGGDHSKIKVKPRWNAWYL